MSTMDLPAVVPTVPAPDHDLDAGAFTVRAAGDLADAASAETLIAPVLDTPVELAVVVDLSAVTYLTMEAVVPLAKLARRCAAEGQVLRLVASSAVRRKVETMGMSTIIPMEPPYTATQGGD
ncbi:STAS domain-containing protein [Amycolatopsis thermoflava]|uniref:STAS domain-containing protein n=1 Tax=Amycolatopsis thermoflava TaxID=84480 RepID=UPI0036601326